MSQSWLADECRQQAVLYLAAAMFAARRGGTRPHGGCRLPLIASDSLLAARLKEEAGTVTGKTATVIREWVDAAFRELSASECGVPDTPWTNVELVGWWLAAGEALAALDLHKSTAVSREVGSDEEGQHPALWCAERLERLSLSTEVFLQETAKKADWQARAGGGRECRANLFRWVMSPDRRRTGLANVTKGSIEWLTSLQNEMRPVGEDAVALFGKGRRLRVGGEISLASSDKWIAGEWRRVGSHWLNELRRPVVYPTPDGEKHLLKGVVVMPPAQVLCKELASLQEADARRGGDRRPDAGLLTRATAFAQARWQPGELVSARWAKVSDPAPRPLAVELVEPAFLAVARWLGAAHLWAEAAAAKDAQAELVEAQRIALALEGFKVREVRGGPLPARRIPHRGDLPDGGTSLTFVRESSGFEVPIGGLGEAASCPEPLFSAIEAVDWRLWAFGAAPWDLSNDVVRQIVDLVRERVVRSDDWEPIKEQALQIAGRPGDEEPLTRLFRHAHERRLALDLLREHVYKQHKPDTMLAGLIDEYGELARQALAALVAIDPASLGRLDPPRRPDGGIDVVAWLNRRSEAGRTSGHHRIRWEPGPIPRGEVLYERRRGEGSVVDIGLSAGQATAADLAILNGPALAIDQPDAPVAVTGGLGRAVAALQARLGLPATGDLAEGQDAIASFREALAAPDSPPLQELIARCRAGDGAAAAWATMLRTDERFRFACHPAFDFESGAIAPARVDDAFLEWDFDATVTAGRDLSVTFAVEPARARRVLSRGARQPGSPADRVQSLFEACRRAGGVFIALGQDARRATDRWLTFGPQAPHPVAAASPLLDELLRAQEVEPALKTEVFTATVEWCAAIDHVVLPSDWRAEGRLLPAALADLSVPPDFDEHVPTGTVVVRSFGLRGVHGRPFAGAVSAGPPPAGYRDFHAAVEQLGDPAEAGSAQANDEILRRTDELAKHALAGTLPLALPNLFDRVWERIAAASGPEARQRAEAANRPLLEMLKTACRMVAFEPATIGEYAAGWVREADGTQPRGRRIKRLVRPGLRTVENVLVRPALVISE